MSHRHLGNRIDVLIAEENEGTRHAMRRLLEQDGYRCQEASTGGEAVKLARQHSPRCVLLDLVPTQEDIAVVRWLRSSPRTRTAFIHCLTWPADEVTQVEATLSGCNTVISKPVDTSKILEVVHEELGCAREWARGLTLRQAENLLDWLERQGAQGQVQIEVDQQFAVRCPGFHIGRDADGHLTVSRRMSLAGASAGKKSMA